MEPEVAAPESQKPSLKKLNSSVVTMATVLIRITQTSTLVCVEVQISDPSIISADFFLFL